MLQVLYLFYKNKYSNLSFPINSKELTNFWKLFYEGCDSTETFRLFLYKFSEHFMFMKAGLPLGVLGIIAVFVIVVSLVSVVFAYPEGWGDDIRLTFDPDNSWYPSLAVDSNNNVHIAWNDDRDGNEEIYYTKLDNNGNTLVEDRRLTFAPAASYVPSLALDSNNNVHIAWNDDRDGNYEIYYTKLDNNGNTLVEDRRLTFAPADSWAPSLALDSNNNVHIAWRDDRDGNREIYYTKLDNDGNTLVDDRRLTFDPAYSYRPSLAVDSNNNVHIAWWDSRDGGTEIYYTKLDNNGNTLVDDRRLTFDPASSRYPSLALDSNNNVHIAWEDYRHGNSNSEIYYTKLDNNGNTLVDDRRLTFDPAYSSWPSLALDSNNNVHIAWHDDRDGNYEIYYTKLDNNGNTLVDDTRLTFDPAGSVVPSLALDSNNNVHIAWHDSRDGNAEIYYKRSLWSFPDLAITPSDITYTPQNPTDGETVNITLTVHNLGNASASNVNIWFYVDGIRKDIVSGVNIDANSYTNVLFFWIPESAGTHNLQFVLDPENLIPETDETNNIAGKDVFVTQSACYDGILNGDEQGVDCGGSCPFMCGYCIPYIQNGNYADKIDVVFIPDTSYNNDIDLFLQHIGEIINNSFMASEEVGANISKINFYYIQEEGFIDWPYWSLEPPNNFFTECSFYDAAVMLHTDSHRDFASGKIFSSEYYNYGTIMHEFGHALFGLADEYGNDSYYFVPEPYPNIYSNETFCRDDATNEGWNPNDCDNFCPANAGNCGNGWWRSDPLPDIMEDDGDNIVPPFQRADVRNIYWTFGQYPDAGFRQTENIFRTALLSLIFENEAITITQIRIIYNNAPEHVALSGDLNLTTLDAENNPITSFLFWDPRIILTENESVYLPEGNTTISVPLSFSETFLNIYNASGDLKLRINMTEQINNFCAYQDGFCDAACPNGIDLDCAPQLQHIDNITKVEGSLVVIVANATDPDDENLAYSINDTRFEQNENVFTWQTHYGDAGLYEINVSVTDNYLEDSQIVDIRVYRPPKPPLPYILWGDGW